MPRALKVFRIAVGFHDAYVAAPTQKAAIEAWGSDRDVFGRGEAEIVTDPKLTAEPLSQPGVVIKRLRGTAEEQIAALPPNKPKSARPSRHSAATKPKKTSRPPKPAPRPSRAALEKIEQALDAAAREHQAAIKRLREKEAALAKERAELEQKQSAQLEMLSRRRDEAESDYRRAMEEWRNS